ncbi:M23 family metallopeptidase [Microbacterium panaciterrae]|uniref:M23ase beta-sheet core domain-containing protein n=1 Tax=Microbacterium panaciterrae TaxID=985759 RepID=A0ABP8PHR1_9MICO
MAAELEPSEKSVAAPPTRGPKHNRSAGGVVRTMRTVVILSAVGALVAAIALPAFASGAPTTQAAAVTSQQLAAGHAQSIVVASEATAAPDERSAFTATTPDEIAQKKAADAAAQAAKAAAEAAAARPATTSLRTSMAPIAQPGQVIYPMAAGSYTLTDGYGAPRDGGRIHTGQDFAAPVGTPIYAAADGCVTVSQESYGGYGVTVMISHPALSGANAVSTLYGHMTYGSRAVQVGQCVTAGQYLGEVGSTGWTAGSCLHFEVQINGTPIDPLAWLEVNVR